MKIQSNSIQPGPSIASQDSNISTTPEFQKEAATTPNNLQPSSQFATSIKSEQSLIANSRAAELQAAIRPDEKMGQLREKLENLKNEKQGLMSQIKATTEKIIGYQIANNQQGIAQASAELAQLQNQLAKVDTQIKSVLSEIEKLQQKENEEQDRVKSQEEQQQAINSNLSKTADSYTSILDRIKP
jgi:chromosome segregation ATPase